MASSDEACVVLVYVDDANGVVSMEDIHSWLSILDEIVEMKLQLDVRSQRTCYSVRFRRSSAAQQAVQYLSGAEVKKCLVTIQSRVFQKEEKPLGASAASDPSRGTAADSAPVRASPHLPDNHVMPSDLRMDFVLVDVLPNMVRSSKPAEKEEEEENGGGSVPLYADGAALHDALRDLQRRYVAVVDALNRADELSQSLDESISAAAQAANPKETDSSSRSDNAAIGHQPSSPPSAALSRWFCGMPTTAAVTVSPRKVVSHLTELYGPVARCCVAAPPQPTSSPSTTVAPVEIIVVQFMMEQDAEAFIRDVVNRQVPPNGGDPTPPQPFGATLRTTQTGSSIDTLNALRWTPLLEGPPLLQPNFTNDSDSRGRGDRVRERLRLLVKTPQPSTVAQR